MRLRGRELNSPQRHFSTEAVKAEASDFTSVASKICLSEVARSGVKFSSETFFIYLVAQLLLGNNCFPYPLKNPLVN